MEDPDEHRVSMDIRGENRSNFPGDPESIHLDKTVCVTGEIYEHDGITYIRVAAADQVKALDFGGHHGGHMVGAIGHSRLQSVMHLAEIWDTFWDTFGIQALNSKSPSLLNRR